MISDEMLSQDEIDALLKGTSDIEDEVNFLSIEDYLSMMELDALGEIGNISFGSSATALSTLLNQKVDITTPAVTLIERGKIAEEFPHPYVAIQVQYTEGFTGINMLVIKQSDAAIIADLMLGGDGLHPSEMLGEIQLSAVQEAMNQMMGSAATSMSTIFSKKVDISPPSIDLLNFLNGEGENAIPDEDLFAKISFRLRVGALIDSNIMQLLPLEFAKGLVSELLNGTSESEADENKMEQIQANPTQSNSPQEPVSFQNPVSNQPTNENYGQSGYQTKPTYKIPNEPQHFGVSSVSTGQPVNVQLASFSSFQPYQLQESETKNLSMLMDIPLQVTVELGRTKRSVKEILELSSGSIIELDKLAGEPVDILVNSRLIAKGEVVVIDENFGVRVTDIMSQSDRLKKLR
ncbi:flagellar motor switch phosphatase FliY [Peribacillus butanolivorans]|uniref:Flagellar motor switch phosphatase FliY n=1 Tax=Peribacillus butanolivorans TaxID=421767 RepID=A0AAX0S707_9BACI|nr:flagellar motor switch phosphatase FliY [Peribacillus butanolivorans]PEJ35059.1 flagellar motor switch phosphatase FliY [Peribacillus butanolivorans]QNU05566.1 flagellar motor switch phosphatase FliY [Peribacillus butanolivorans]